jgi:hypothetical protein
MSGYIINPFSSDFNPTSSTTFSSQSSIPMLAYGLIGLTSLTLAYLSLVDFKESKSSNTNGFVNTNKGTSFVNTNKGTNSFVNTNTPKKSLFSVGGKNKNKTKRKK